MFAHLLIIADQKKPHIALKRGLAFAERANCKVTVIAYCYQSLALVNPEEQAKVIKKILAARKAELQAEINTLSNGKKVNLQVQWAKQIAPEICHYVKGYGVDLVLKSGRRSESLLHNPTDWQLFREAPCSVMVLSNQKWRKTRSVLAAIDLKTRKKAKQELNHKILLQASELAALMETTLHVVDVIHIPALLREFDIVDAGEETRKARSDMKARIKQLSRQYQIPVENFHIKSGDVDKVISSTAAKVKADLLVLGTVGRKGVKAKVLGNTAEKVLSSVKTDVFTIRI